MIDLYRKMIVSAEGFLEKHILNDVQWRFVNKIEIR